MAVYTCNGSVRANKASKVKVPFTCKLDFANVTPEQMMAFASDAIIVRLQGNARRVNDADDNKLPFATIVKNTMDTTVNVAKLLANSRGPAKSAPVKIAEQFAKLDANTRKTLLEMLSKSAK